MARSADERLAPLARAWVLLAIAAAWLILGLTTDITTLWWLGAVSSAILSVTFFREAHRDKRQ